jgi:hypothetical protein
MAREAQTQQGTSLVFLNSNTQERNFLATLDSLLSYSSVLTCFTYQECPKASVAWRFDYMQNVTGVVYYVRPERLREIHGKPHGEWQAGDGGEVDNLFRAWIDIESVNIPSPLAMLAVQNHEVVIEFHIGESDISPVLMPACTNRPR